MIYMELVLNMLAEVSAADLSKETDPTGMTESEKVAMQGGSVAKAARQQYKKQSGKKVVTPLNAKNLKALKDNKEGIYAKTKTVKLLHVQVRLTA